MGTKKSFDISNGTEKRLFKKAENFNLDFLEIPKCKIYRFSEESTEMSVTKKVPCGMVNKYLKRFSFSICRRLAKNRENLSLRTFFG